MMKKVLTILGVLTGFCITLLLFPVSLSVAENPTGMDNTWLQKTKGGTANISLDDTVVIPPKNPKLPTLSAPVLLALKTQSSDPLNQEKDRTRRAPQAEQNKALQARKLANLIPYGQIARRAKKRFGGRIVNQKLTQTGPNKWVYELKVLRKNGKVVSVTMDAQTGKILKTRGERRR